MESNKGYSFPPTKPSRWQRQRSLSIELSKASQESSDDQSETKPCFKAKRPSFTTSQSVGISPVILSRQPFIVSIQCFYDRVPYVRFCRSSARAGSIVLGPLIKLYRHFSNYCESWRQFDDADLFETKSIANRMMSLCELFCCCEHMGMMHQDDYLTYAELAMLWGIVKKKNMVEDENVEVSKRIKLLNIGEFTDVFARIALLLFSRKPFCEKLSGGGDREKVKAFIKEFRLDDEAYITQKIDKAKKNKKGVEEKRFQQYLRKGGGLTAKGFGSAQKWVQGKDGKRKSIPMLEKELPHVNVSQSTLAPLNELYYKEMKTDFVKIKTKNFPFLDMGIIYPPYSIYTGRLSIMNVTNHRVHMEVEADSPWLIVRYKHKSSYLSAGMGIRVDITFSDEAPAGEFEWKITVHIIDSKSKRTLEKTDVAFFVTISKATEPDSKLLRNSNLLLPQAATTRL